MVERLASDLRDIAPAPPVAESAPEAAPDAVALPAGSASPRFQLRLVPIVMVVLLAFALPVITSLLIDFASDHARLPWIRSSNLSFQVVHESVLLVLALIAIAIARRVVPADYGLHWPHKRSYIGAALLFGVAFGLLMALVDFAPQIVNHTAPKFDDPLTRSFIAGWLAFAGLYAGITQEVRCRALLVTYLATTLPGKVRFGKFEMNGAGIVVALILAIPVFVAGFVTLPPFVALLQLAYTIAFGVFCAYWLEKSGSILAPIVAANVSGLVKFGLMFAMIAAWHY